MLGNLFENRAINFQTLWGAGNEVEITNQSGTFINQDTVFKVNAVFSAISLISDTIATLPVDAYIRRDGARFAYRPRPTWVTKPDIDTTKEGFYGSVIVSLLLDGNAFIRVFRDDQGQPLNLVVLNPSKVEIQRNGLGRVMFHYEGEKSLLSTDEVLHIPDVVRPGHIRGTSRVDALKDNFGLAMALESYAARFFGQGVTMAGHIEFPGNLSPEQAKELSDSFSSRHGGFRKSHKVGILSAGAKFVSDQLDNDKSQFIDSRRMAVEDVARTFNIPPHLLGLPGTNTYSSVEQNNIGFVTHTIRPIVSKMETALSGLLSTLPGGENAFIKFTMDALLRGDANTRFSSYSTGIQAGYLTVNDIRRFEDLTPIEGGDVLRVPLANINIDAADLVAEDKKVTMANKLIMSGFDPAEVLAAFDLPAIAHTGLPSVQLQPLVNVNPDNPQDEYQVD